MGHVAGGDMSARRFDIAVAVVEEDVGSEGFEERLEALVRRAVVEHSLYGVDIDPLAVRLAKASMNALARPNEQMAMTVESSLQAVLFDSADKHDRMQAFLEKRAKK